MHARQDRERAVLAKLRDLSEERMIEVEDFVDFLRARDEQRQLADAALGISAPSAAAVWDNADDDVYNDL